MNKLNRRQFLKLTTSGLLGLYVSSKLGPAQLLLAKPVDQKVNGKISLESIPGGTLDPTAVPKYQTPMLIPPAMPRADVIKQIGGKSVDY